MVLIAWHASSDVIYYYYYQCVWAFMYCNFCEFKISRICNIEIHNDDKQTGAENKQKCLCIVLME